MGLTDPNPIIQSEKIIGVQTDIRHMREPAAAGTFYPANRKGLIGEIRDSFRNGPGKVPEGDGGGGKRILGLVSPHAGYVFSGMVAAFGFRAMWEGGLPETVIVIGPNHHGWGVPVALSMSDMRTPLGIMKCDTGIASLIGVEEDETAHIQEHSMEVQLPFLQYMKPDMGQVCIAMTDQGLDTSKELGKKVAGAVKRTKGDVGIIASSDFTHCGWNYGCPVPAGKNAGEFARSIDLPFIRKLIEWDLDEAYRLKRELGVTACGLGPVAAMLTAVSELGGEKAELLDYRTSYDVHPSDSAVGYSSIVVW